MRRPIDEVSAAVVDAAIRTHRDLGPGLLESVYEMVLAERLRRSGWRVSTQHPIDIEVDDMSFPAAFRIDLLVDERLVVEIKAVERLGKSHAKQLLTYLRLTDQPVGLLLNFNHATMKEGIRRLVNNYQTEPSSANSAPLRERIRSDPPCTHSKE